MVPSLDLVHSIELKTTLLSFEHAIKIFINKPQVVNKWVAGSTLLNLNEIDRRLWSSFDVKPEQIELRQFLSKSNKIFQDITYLIVDDLEASSSVLFVPILNKVETTTLKYPAVSFAHRFEMNTSESKLNLYADRSSVDTAQLTWLTATLLPKLATWSQCIKTDAEFTCAKANTLTLYPNMLEDYVKLYMELKALYWPRFAPIWLAQTNTEPEKFIHEDIAIASYLILAWSHFNLSVKCFVDVGCGNGLLVYILNDQGFAGYGVDMRRRKIWSNDFYTRAGVRLLEETIEPKSSRFEGADFLIGNHSDELSPWLPVLAYKTSFLSRASCSYLLIPCCMFDFNSKFNYVGKKGSIGTSRNEAYLDYMRRIGQVFGFKVLRDKLRIPSTRNAAFLGIFNLENVNYSEIESIDETISDKINELTLNFDSNKVDGFKARDLELETAKSSRNCTKNVDSELKIFILRRVLSHLLEEVDSEPSLFVEKHDGTKWNAGRQSVRLNEIAGLFDRTVLGKLKLECGGIKTLLKNHHKMFVIADGDLVRLKTREDVLEPEKRQFIKSRGCIYDLFHPQGCWQSSEQCFFIHKDL
jgi:tRNASer (uridine44-2'-O)-methyltransferase